jgi:hypothetical protein
MELGNKEQREEFLRGMVPKGAIRPNEAGRISGKRDYSGLLSVIFETDRNASFIGAPCLCMNGIRLLQPCKDA